MPDYQESSVTGQAWQRCHQVVIENPRHGSKVVRFDEERVLALDGNAEVRTPAGTLAVPFEPGTLIPLRDPATGELTGDSISYGKAYAVIYSAYLAAAQDRDAADQPAATEINSHSQA
jgi:hypothetical protein